MFLDGEQPSREIDGAQKPDCNSNAKNERPHDGIARHDGVGAERDYRAWQGSAEEAKECARERQPPSLALVGLEYANDRKYSDDGADPEHGTRCPKAARDNVIVKPAGTCERRDPHDEEHRENGKNHAKYGLRFRLFDVAIFHDQHSTTRTH